MVYALSECVLYSNPDKFSLSLVGAASKFNFCYLLHMESMLCYRNTEYRVNLSDCRVTISSISTVRRVYAASCFFEGCTPGLRCLPSLLSSMRYMAYRRVDKRLALFACYELITRTHLHESFVYRTPYLYFCGVHLI